MTFFKASAALALAVSVSACAVPEDKGRDRNIFDGGKGHLSNMTAGIWVDPQGCEHWIIDDGVEGYMDLRRTPDGRAVCHSDLPRNTAVGPFKAGSRVPDPV